MKKILFLPLLLSTLFAMSQTRTLNGKVVSATDQRAVGMATVTVKNGKSFIANDSGYFHVEVPARELSLTVSSIGFAQKEITVKPDDNNIIITLIETNKDLDEVVVMGYSNKKKGELTSAVTVIDAPKLKDVTTNDVGSMLQGKVAGLQVVNSSGVPGANAEIRLRGVSSINASQTPLYVVDGIIGGNFDPNDVASITVLKDAAATAMYGSQANAGVIVVTTKTATTAKPNIEVKATTGFRTPDFGELDMMNGSQLYNYQKQFYRDYIPTDTGNSYKIDLLKFYAERPISLDSQNHNWLTTIFKPAFMQNYYVSVSGKTDKNDYYLGASYYNEDGTFMNTNYQRANLRASLGLHFSSKVSLTNTINISGVTGKSYDYNDIYYAFLNLPWDNPYDKDGNPVYVDGNSTSKWWSRDKVNPVHTIENSNHPYKGFDINYDLNFNYEINNWLTLSSTNRVAADYSKSTSYYSPDVAGQYHGTGYLEEGGVLSYSGISNDLLKFNFKLGNHRISGLAGVAFEGGKTETSGASGRGLPF